MTLRLLFGPLDERDPWTRQYIAECDHRRVEYVRYWREDETPDDLHVLAAVIEQHRLGKRCRCQTTPGELEQWQRQHQPATA